jgi:hypothetical protein
LLRPISPETLNHTATDAWEGTVQRRKGGEAACS